MKKPKNYYFKSKYYQKKEVKIPRSKYKFTLKQHKIGKKKVELELLLKVPYLRT